MENSVFATLIKSGIGKVPGLEEFIRRTSAPVSYSTPTAERLLLAAFSGRGEGDAGVISHAITTLFALQKLRAEDSLAIALVIGSSGLDLALEEAHELLSRFLLSEAVRDQIFQVLARYLEKFDGSWTWSQAS